MTARSRTDQVQSMLVSEGNHDMEVLLIADVIHAYVHVPNPYLHLDSSGNPPEVQNCGTMVAFKTKMSYQTDEINTMWIVKPLIYPPPYNSILYFSHEISQIFYHRKSNLIGFTFSSIVTEEITHGGRSVPRRGNSLVMRLASAHDRNIGTTGTVDELDVFLNFCSKMRPDLQPIEMFNRSYIKKFLTDPAQKVFNAEEVVDKIFQEKQMRPNFSVQYFGELMRPYFKPYVYFMLQNHDLDKKAIKKKISSVDNIPEFMKSLSWTDEIMLFCALCSFLARHACRNPECDGFSLLRCGGCDSDLASYCNVECQEKGSKAHECEEEKEFRRRRDEISEMIENNLEMCLGKKVSISVHSFSKSLMTKIYRSFYGALKNRYFLSHLHEVLLKGQDLKRKSNAKMLNLVKRGRDTQSLYTIRTQLEQTYGVNNKVVKLMKPS